MSHQDSTTKLQPFPYALSGIPAFYSWLSCSVGITIGSLLPVLPYSRLYCLCLASATILLLFIAVIIKPAWLRICLFLGIGFISITAARTREQIIFDGTDQTQQSVTINALATTSSESDAVLNTWRTLITIDSTSSPGTAGLKGITVRCYSNIKLPGNTRIRIVANYTPPRRPSNPYAFDEIAFSRSNGIYGTLSCDSVTVIATRPSLLSRRYDYVRGIENATLSRVTNRDLRALLQASFSGERTMMSPDLSRLFRDAGIFHLIAISGFNVAVVISILIFIIGWTPIPRAMKIIIIIGAIWLYLDFVGYIPSLFRAVVMSTALLSTFLFQKKSSPLNALGLSGIVWLIMAPFTLFSPSYQLSFGATLGILLLYKPLSRFTPVCPLVPLEKYFLKPLFSSLWVSLASFFGTLPMLVYSFGSIALFGLFANLFAVMLMAVVLWTFIAAMALQALLPPLATIAIFFTEQTLKLLLWTSSWVWLVPGSVIKTGTITPEWYLLYVLFFIALLGIQHKRLRTILLIILPLIGLSCAATRVAINHYQQPEGMIVFDQSVKQTLKTASLPPPLIAIKTSDRRMIIINNTNLRDIRNRTSGIVFPYLMREPRRDYSVILSEAIPNAHIFIDSIGSTIGNAPLNIYVAPGINGAAIQQLCSSHPRWRYCSITRDTVIRFNRSIAFKFDCFDKVLSSFLTIPEHRLTATIHQTAIRIDSNPSIADSNRQSPTAMTITNSAVIINDRTPVAGTPGSLLKKLKIDTTGAITISIKKNAETTIATQCNSLLYSYPQE